MSKSHFILFSSLTINFSHSPTCIIVSRPALSSHSPAFGFDENHFILAFISQFFPSRPQMETLWFSFPRSYKLKERQNVKDFFDVSAIFSCSSHHTLTPQPYKTVYETFFYFLKYRRQQLLTKTFCHRFVHINCQQIQPY